MSRGTAGALVAIALAAGLALRFARLDVRPMHHDEANQAVKFGALLEHGEYRYDAHDHHGPTLYYLTLPAAAIRGQTTLAALDERTLRGVTAAFGAATILLLPFLSAGLGRTAVAGGAWLMALSPATVYYSRMFIQESLFAFFALAFVIAVGRLVVGGGILWAAGAGLAAGLAVATKETSIIVLPAALAACAIACWGSTRSGAPDRLFPKVRWRVAGPLALLTGCAAAALFYSSFLTNPEGVLGPLQAARTYLDRGVAPASHVHPWHYYLGLLTYSSSGGLRWSEALIVVLAAVGALSGWSRGFWPRYLTVYVVLTAVAFSAISYKTPWNLLPFYVGTIVLAGVGVSAALAMTASRPIRVAIGGALVLGCMHLGRQAWLASVTYAADPRNPYVYAQTVPDAVRMAERIRRLADVHPDGTAMQVSVIAPPHEQWPLPWYLRTLPHVGYWARLDDERALAAPVLVASIENTEALERDLGDGYIAEFYGLRPEVLLTLYIERGLWDRFLAQAALAR